MEIHGVVRWVKPASSAEDDRAPLASWEVGIAFAWIGQVDPEGIWRGLRIYRETQGDAEIET